MKPEFLQKISISGYKSIKDATVELNRVNVLIGSNGAGKSLFLTYLVEQNQGLQIHHFTNTSVSSPMKQMESLVNHQYLDGDGGNLAPFLYRLKSDYQKEYVRIVRTTRLIAPYFDDFHLEPNKGHIQLLWKEKGSDDVLSPTQISDGTLRFICLATLLLQPEDLKPATIIIDEPELGLHPFAITILAELVRKSGSQVILSTQSVELLNQFDIEDVIVAERGENGTELKRLDPEALEMWLEDYSLGELWQKNVLGGRLTPRR